jgi:hypothetical protein
VRLITLQAELEALLAPGARHNLRARGLARGLIWREGQLPVDAPNFDTTLTERLEDHAFRLLAKLMPASDEDVPKPLRRAGYAAAGELLESAYRRSSRENPDRGHHLLLAALCYELAGYSARAFTSIADQLDELNLTRFERVVALLLRRDINHALRVALEAIQDADSREEALIERLENGEAEISEAVEFAAGVEGIRQIARFLRGYLSGIPELEEAAISDLGTLLPGIEGQSLDATWWVHRLAAEVMTRLRTNNLHEFLAAGGVIDQPGARGFLQFMAAQPRARIDVWPSQTRAIQTILTETGSVLVSLPTSAGKTRVAEVAMMKALLQGQRVIYTTPLRALSAYFERHFTSVFGTLGFRVSALYGAAGVSEPDAVLLQGFDIIVATPEKLDFACRANASALDGIGLIVLDEGHMIGQGTREVRYELLIQRLLTLPDAASRRLLCLSAVLPDGLAFDQFAAWLTQDRPKLAIRSTWRPTRKRAGILAFNNGNGKLLLRVEDERPFLNRYVEAMAGTGRRRKPFPGNDRQELVTATALRLVRDGHTVLVYCPVRSHAESLAKRMVELVQARQIPVFRGATISPEELAIFREWLGDGHPAFRALEIGVGVHHAHLPAPVLRLIEKLLEEKRLRVVLASPTVSQGLDLPYSAVVFHSMTRFSSTTKSTRAHPGSRIHQRSRPSRTRIR